MPTRGCLKLKIQQENLRYHVWRSLCFCSVGSCSCLLPTACGRWRGLRPDRHPELCHAHENNLADDAGKVVCYLRTRFFLLIPPIRAVIRRSLTVRLALARYHYNIAGLYIPRLFSACSNNPCFYKYEFICIYMYIRSMFAG